MAFPVASRSRLGAVLILIAIVVGACSSSGSSGTPGASGAQPYAGTKLVVWGLSDGPYAFIPDMIPDFTKATGIDVQYVTMAASEYQDKLPLAQSAKDSSYDVFMNGPNNLADYIAKDAIADLAPFINDPNKTPAEWDYADIGQGARDACTIGDQTHCVISNIVGAMLFYNKKHFADAGITDPPKTHEELLADAIKLNTSEHAGFCLRGSKDLLMLNVAYLWSYYFPYADGVRGTWFDKDWNFNPGKGPVGYEAAQWYRDIMTQAAPAGIANVGYKECADMMAHGQVSMFWDAMVWVTNFEDSTQSTVAGDIGYTEIPCRPANPDHCVPLGPWGGFMNKWSNNKDAAWQFLMWVTSKEVLGSLAKAGNLSASSRASVNSDPDVQAKYPVDYLNAVTYANDHGSPALFANVPEGTAMYAPNSPAAIAYSNLETNVGTVQENVDQMAAGVAEVMKAAGYPKPVPGAP